MMEKQYRCGGCGETKHELFREGNTITTVCCSCKSKSSIYMSNELNVDWHEEEGKGCLCIF